jgi:hypothetical protein
MHPEPEMWLQVYCALKKRENTDGVRASLFSISKKFQMFCSSLRDDIALFTYVVKMSL